jgi:hypothetical protein
MICASLEGGRSNGRLYRLMMFLSVIWAALQRAGANRGLYGLMRFPRYILTRLIDLMFDNIRSKPSRIVKFTAFEIDFIFCEIDFLLLLLRLINTYNLNELLVVIVG